MKLDWAEFARNLTIVSVLVLCIMSLCLVWDGNLWWNDTFARVYLTDVSLFITSFVLTIILRR